MVGPSTNSYDCAAEPVPTSAPATVREAHQTTSQTGAHKPSIGGKSATTISSNPAPSCSRDPSRPRRKKAKRACYACQRAHLTCGDERPCQRCIKRGLQDQCQDGVRKKAKYLHDAPNEALVPGAQGAANLFSQPPAGHIPLMQAPQSGPASSMFSRTAMGFNGMYGQKAGQQTANMAVPSLYENGANNFNTRASVSPTFTLPSSASGATATGSTSTATTLSGLGDPGFNSAFFDPSHPALFNFDLASMNFDNHYGAMEFGILAHMTGTGNGSVDSENAMSANNSVSTPRPHSTSTTLTTNATRLADSNHEASGSTCTVPSLDSPNDSSNLPYGAMFDGASSLNAAGDWSATNGAANELTLGDPLEYKYAQPSETAANAFVIESARTPSLTSDSPESDADTFVAEHGEENVDCPVGLLPEYGGRETERDTGEVRKPWTQPLRRRSSQGRVQKQSTNNPRKRRRSPDELYKSVKKPYSYTNGFHNLTAYIHKRFSPSKTLQIAKALASIRPSLIATNKTLDAADLIFMEKCFQRTLWEYEDFINVVGTPTIICRRTGEVAAVGKEFCMLTGWKKEILLGQEPNENINMGGGSGSGRKNVRNNWPFRENNPAAPQVNANENQPRPVLLAELLDDESVIEFYDDFAKLAFGDSRGSIMTTCKLLKYQTKNDVEADKKQGGQCSDVQPRWAKKGIAGQQGLTRLGASDGKVECSYCWTVKRDVFDIPMLIVMNFLPAI